MKSNYKTFKDIKVGDTLYYYNEVDNSLEKFKIIKIIDTSLLLKFYYDTDDYLSIDTCDLDKSKFIYVYSDITYLLKEIYERV